jgi:hypothetical protein
VLKCGDGGVLRFAGKQAMLEKSEKGRLALDEISHFLIAALVATAPVLACTGDGVVAQNITSGGGSGAGGTSTQSNMNQSGGSAGSGSMSRGGSPTLGGTGDGSAGAATDESGSPVAGGDAGPVMTSPSFSSCALKFPYQDEPDLGTWLGGDSAYSTMLTPTMALWSFQDTFVGKHGQAGRQGAGLIANSFAHVSCDNGAWSIQYRWGGTSASPRAVFADGTPNQRFWPQQPFIHQGMLFTAMTRVAGASTEVGTSLARVHNPMDPPGQWNTDYFDLAPISGLGKGTVLLDGYAYLFGTVGSTIATRLPLDELIKPGAVPTALLQYLANDGQWKQGFVAGDLKRLGFAANVGTSFRYLKKSSQWLVLFTNTSSWPSPNIAVATAPSLEGPWGNVTNVYKVPEMTPGAPEYDVDNVCYAAIEHPESNSDPENELLFSYTCNSLVSAKQIANVGIYLPKIVKMKNPLAN